MRFTKITEADSNHDKLEQMSVEQLSLIINEEDQTVANAVKKILPQINSFIEATLPKMQQGGRLIYIGAGTSGRLGILDCLLYTSPSPRDGLLSRMPSSA